MQPINYLLENKNPLDMLFGNMNQYQIMQDNQAKLQAAQDKANLEQQAITERQGLDFTDPNALKKYAAQYPEYSKGITDYLANLSEQERQALLADTSKIQSLLNYGDTENAVKLLEERAVAYDNAKNPNKAADYRSMAGLVKTNKNAALQSLQMLYSTAAGKDAMAGYKDFMGARAPDVKVQNGGDRWIGIVTDPVTGKTTYQDVGKINQSPDNFANNQTSLINNKNDNETRVTTANIAADASRYGADKSSETGIRVASINGEWGYKKEKLNQDGANFRQAKTMQQEDNQVEIREVGGYMLRLYGKNGSRGVDVIGKAQPKQDASTLGKVADIQSMNDSANQTIAQLKKAKELSRQGIYSGYGASGRADAMGSVPFLNGTEKSKRTQEYTNIIVNSALQSLKAVFGGAPTEGERAMLIKVQASADYPQEVREKILDQAIEMAQAKIASNNRQIGTLTGQQPSYPQASAPPTGIAKPQQQGGYISGKYK